MGRKRSKGKINRTNFDRIDEDEPLPVGGSRYMSPFIRLIEIYPDLFDRSIGESAEDGKRAKTIDLEPSEPCPNCGVIRGQACVGNVFCHICSGVDTWPLTESLLSPALQRRRFYSREGRGLAPSAPEARKMTRRIQMLRRHRL